MCFMFMCINRFCGPTLDEPAPLAFLEVDGFVETNDSAITEPLFCGPEKKTHNSHM